MGNLPWKSSDFKDSLLMSPYSSNPLGLLRNPLCLILYTELTTFIKDSHCHQRKRLRIELYIRAILWTHSHHAMFQGVLNSYMSVVQHQLSFILIIMMFLVKILIHLYRLLVVSKEVIIISRDDFFTTDIIIFINHSLD